MADWSRVTLAALLALMVCLYVPLRDAPFVYEDDNWIRAVATPAPVSAIGRVTSYRTLHWTYLHAGMVPDWYHLGNVALHGVNSVLVYTVASSLVSPVGAVLAGGLVFALHPLNSEAVSYVSARSDLLMTTGVLLAVWLALGTVTWWRWGLVGLALLLASSSKELGVVGVPLVLWTLVCWRITAPWTVMAPLWIGWGALIGVSWAAVAGWLTMSPAAGGSVFTWPEFVVLQLTALWHQLALLPGTGGFSIDHDIVGISLQGRVLAVLCTMALAAVAVLAWSRARLVTWAVGWLAISVGPRLVVRSNELLNEHQWYLGMVGVSVLIGAGLARLCVSAPRKVSFA